MAHGQVSPRDRITPGEGSVRELAALARVAAAHAQACHSLSRAVSILPWARLIFLPRSLKTKAAVAAF